MNLTDLIIMIISSIFIIRGFRKGYKTQVAAIVAFMLAFTFTVPAAKVVAVLAEEYYMLDSNLLSIISGAFCFILIYLISTIIVKVILGGKKEFELSYFNKTLGGVLGIFKGFAVFTFLLLIVRILPAGEDIISSHIETETITVSQTLSQDNIVERLDSLSTEMDTTASAIQITGINQLTKDSLIAKAKVDSIQMRTDLDSLLSKTENDSSLVMEYEVKIAENQLLLDSLLSVTPKQNKKFKSKLGSLAYILTDLVKPIIETTKMYFFPDEEVIIDENISDY